MAEKAYLAVKQPHAAYVSYHARMARRAQHLLTDDIRLPITVLAKRREKRKLRAARGSGITATKHLRRDASLEAT